MADDEPKLTQQELTVVLRKAAEIEGREGPRSFTGADALAAGRELGLAAGTIEAVLADHWARKRDVQLVERPFDTRIVVETAPDRFVAQLPARGPHMQALARVTAGLVTLPFVAFWTAMAVTTGAPTIFPLMSLPFWAVGLGILGSGIGAMITSHRLELDRREGRLVARPFGRTRILRPSELRPRLDRLRVFRNRGGEPIHVPVLALDHGTRTFHLLAGFSEVEQRWVKAELDRWLAG
jgi:hypothetical protein